MIEVFSDRFTNKTQIIYDLDWNRLPFLIQDPGLTSKISHQIDRPEKLEEMIRLAEKLSHGIPFVRVDLYSVQRIYFGEMTFIPNAGYSRFDPPEWDEIVGDWFNLTWRKTDFNIKKNK